MILRVVDVTVNSARTIEQIIRPWDVPVALVLLLSGIVLCIRLVVPGGGARQFRSRFMQPQTPD